MLEDPVTVHAIFRAALAVLSVVAIAMVSTVVFAFREVYLSNRRLKRIITIGTQLPLVQPLKLEIGVIPAGSYAIVTEIYERPAALNNKKVPRYIIVLKIHGFKVAMSATDMKYYFIEELGLHWNYRAR